MVYTPVFYGALTIYPVIGAQVDKRLTDLYNGEHPVPRGMQGIAESRGLGDVRWQESPYISPAFISGFSLLGPGGP